MASATHRALGVISALVGPAAAASASDPHELIAFCQAYGKAAPPGVEEPCFCSVEGIEQPLAPGQFLRHMRERQAAGATGPAEMLAAERHALAVCAPRDLATAPPETDGGGERASATAAATRRTAGPPSSGGAPAARGP